MAEKYRCTDLCPIVSVGASGWIRQLLFGACNIWSTRGGFKQMSNSNRDTNIVNCALLYYDQVLEFPLRFSADLSVQCTKHQLPKGRNHPALDYDIEY